MAEVVKKKKKKPLKLLLFLFFVMVEYSEQMLPPSQFQAIQRIKQELSFPVELSSWSENSDFCNTEPLPILTLVCYEDNITQLHVAGNGVFPQFPQDISTSSLFSNLASLPNLKVLSLVSLGLRGPLPPSIGLLSSLEIVNISSNSFNGSLPVEISSLKSLQTLVLDNNRFSGQVPDWLASLPALTVLSLKNNSFTGLLPSSLTSLELLRNLVVSGNNLSGDLPNFHNLSNLQVLDLEGNGFGPNFPSLPTKLVALMLGKNKFGFGVPDEVESCYLLTKMDISHNEFVGPLPPSLLSMPSIDYLDISGNKFTGKLFKNMSCNSQLSYVDFSSNRFTGELPDCLQPGTGHTTVFYSGNCLSSMEQWQHHESFCHNEALAVRIMPTEHKEKRPYAKVVLASSMVGGLIGGTALLGLAFFVVKKKFAKQQQINRTPNARLILEKVPPAITLKLLNDARYISETRKFGLLGIPPYRTFVLDELREATNNFDVANILGEGSCGQIYKGMLTDGTVVAIRSLKTRKKHSIQHYTHQLELVSKIRHCHLVSAIGHCFECYQDDSSVSRIFLVFEFVPNGTLREVISEGNAGQKFSWSQRMTAMLGIARGIQFLHTGIVPGVFSNHLKITDILLDHDFHVKISKYNLPLLAENKNMDAFGASSSGGKENAAQRSAFKEKDDVYGFGVILLETIVGRKMMTANDIDVSKDILSVSLTADELARRSIVDPAVCKECSDHSLKTVMELCLRCLSNEQSDSPSVEDVIWNLQFAAQVQDSCRRDSHSAQCSPGHVALARSASDLLQ
nr:probable inactive leucine-rich repeat receptor-like protein kinase At3g03770 [Ipomoea batatas]